MNELTTRPTILVVEDVAGSVWGCPYEAALARSESGDEKALRQSLEQCNALGAQPLGTIVARRLRELGVRDVPRSLERPHARTPQG